MPRIVGYHEVLATADGLGLRCTYPRGGAFLLSAEPRQVACWSAMRDESVRPQLRERVIAVSGRDLAVLVMRAWERFATGSAGGGGGVMWLLPVHHWAAELEHGRDEEGRDIGRLLAAAGLAEEEIAPLASRTCADAVELRRSEAPVASALVEGLLGQMWKSDFTLLFPPARVVGMLHHHRQVWWQCPDAETADRLLEMGREVSRG